jgi:hypothetical protein
MLKAEDIREWRGCQVVDVQGEKIGELEALYVDTRTDQFCFITVKITGLLSRPRLAFVPLAGATVGPGYLKVACPRKLVKDAPAIHTDGELFAGDEPAVFKHYGLPYDAGETERLLARR